MADRRDCFQVDPRLELRQPILKNDGRRDQNADFRGKVPMAAIAHYKYAASALKQDGRSLPKCVR
jgi:hypothetical protein